MDKIMLKGGQYYVTPNGQDACRVEEGSVFVYIVPWRDGRMGRRLYLYEAAGGEVIPGFAFTDNEYCSWRFCLVAVDCARLGVIEGGATKVLRQKFAQKAGIRHFAQEGFEYGLVDQYKLHVVAGDGMIHKTVQEQRQTREDTLKLISDVFNKDALDVELHKGKEGIYDAMAFLCRKNRMTIAPYEKVKESCQKAMTVADIARVSHFAYREVILEEKWYTKDSGPLLAFTQEHQPVVCLPRGTHGYDLVDVSGGKRKKLDKKTADKLTPKAYCIYRPLPAKALGWKDIAKFCMGSLNRLDCAAVIFFTCACALIGLLIPVLNQQIYDTYIGLGDRGMIVQLCSVSGAFMIGSLFFSIVNNLSGFRIASRMGYDVLHASYDRLFNLPESFFRHFDSGDLAQRVMGIGQMVNTVASIVVSTVLATLFSLMYLVRMFGYSKALAWTATALLLIYMLILWLLTSRSMRYEKSIAKLDGETDAKMFQFLNGIAKIRIAGVENRALFEYLKVFTKLRRKEMKKGRIDIFMTVIHMAADSIFALALYGVMIYSGIGLSAGQFIAFMSAFGAFSAAVLSFMDSVTKLRGLKPGYERILPLFETLPETDGQGELPGKLEGNIEISNVNFSYEPDGPNVLDGISLNIKAGEYVGIAGSSGCGKSTLLKLLLGFEKPVSGKIYYDDKDIDSLDKRELRKCFGVVLQDGKLISGSIFENITITAPSATVADVENVVRAVGLEKDIAQMPMGLHTVLSEDCQTISGGQQQRILIARAIIGKPGILFFDEATSALDNVTQAMVCESLDKMQATRLVIAHRLSTIKNCDRIIVMDKGRVAEQGNYEQLMAGKGLFYQLASRQL